MNDNEGMIYKIQQHPDLAKLNLDSQVGDYMQWTGNDIKNILK